MLACFPLPSNAIKIAWVPYPPKKQVLKKWIQGEFSWKDQGNISVRDHTGIPQGCEGESTVTGRWAKAMVFTRFPRHALNTSRLVPLLPGLIGQGEKLPITHMETHAIFSSSSRVSMSSSGLSRHRHANGAQIFIQAKRTFTSSKAKNLKNERGCCCHLCKDSRHKQEWQSQTPTLLAWFHVCLSPNKQARLTWVPRS